MKQTSIDWLVSVLAHNDIIDHKLLSTREDKYKLYKRLVEQAKKMHKEEIVDAFDEGQEYEYQYHINGTPKFYSETYYKETYGGEK